MDARHRFHYPFRKGDRYPPWLVDMGFRLVEALGGWKVPLAYRRQSAQQAAEDSAMAAGLGGPLRGEVAGKPDLLHRHAAQVIARGIEARLGKRGKAPKGMIERERIDGDDIARIVGREHGVRLVDLVRRRLPWGGDPHLGR
ncbi:TPA: hypothetical protein QEM39_002674 [Pseudomonas putida]|uniref:hypothetical protein n=1 Tax=Pseudomonas putida TaxID=303 RepID=UPI002363B5C0|nr:hypothetical protein [Pseudomonas putida]MDD2149522.1 hypothetical protein [Pseudomonas putida]HDS1681128.1 hypothetical protein [Pseudomonas putida]